MLLTWARPAPAASVAIVRPHTSSPEVAETVSRLRGELFSLGLDVSLADRPDTRGLDRVDALAWLEQLTGEHRADAVIDILGHDAPVAIDVWIVKKAPRRFEVTRVPAEPNTINVSERLALRAAEAVRGSLLELDLAARPRPEEPATPPQAPRASEAGADEPPSRRERLGIEAGAQAIMSLDNVGPAVLPLVRVNWMARPSLALQVALAGLGTRPTVATPIGQARVAQHYGVLGVRYRLRPDQRLWPFLALSAGVLRTSVEGQSGSGVVGHHVPKWSFLLDGSIGAGFRLRGRYHLTVAAHAQVARPYVAIHFLDGVAATTGRPNVLLSVALGAWL